ncbi:methyltransferase RsmF C-terminal domain-like protein [Xylanibacter muris]|uniref:SAM-dependent MTase RsmB/NOP-type domain-containing protein n=1 Tax=Xylanibacter muris TaxID=2736290 RepID=A0ABX2ALD4_9BACT|nr:hypothetical protein [Xylanibacter muris]NPD92018.1 hypothetical protein [Xylanibacter muris]
MNLPESFTSYTKALIGDGLFGKLLHGLTDEEPPASIRINGMKHHIHDEDTSRQAIPWCEYGMYLDKRPAFTFDPLFHAGHYYVQEASSMFLHHILKSYISSPVIMLDMCAAPGGKSTTAMGALPEGSTLIANEPVRQRSQILAENIQKWGNPGTIVTNNYPKDFAKSGMVFDVILCDVPCSGEGMFRKDEDAVREWSTQNVENCRNLQREIVAQAWKCLSEGGLLVYSTCTFNAKENEENVKWISEELGAEILPVAIEEQWGITGSLLKGFQKPVYRFLPGVTKGEGLFMAALRKNGQKETATSIGKKKNKKEKKERNNGIKSAQLATSWLTAPDNFNIAQSGNTLTAIPKPMAGIYATASEKLKVIHAGVTLGTIKGKDIIPAQGLALSTEFNTAAFPSVELSYSDALRYLRKEALSLPEDTPQGFVVMTYHGTPLGFSKNIGNRANNLYPQEWKIKSARIPDNDVSPL